MDDLVFMDATEPVLGIGQGMSLLQVHSPDKCTGQVCCIHNPSDHHMRTWQQSWRADKGMTERLCPHGIGHPDPDDLLVRTTSWAGVHGCDGCCRPPCAPHGDIRNSRFSEKVEMTNTPKGEPVLIGGLRACCLETLNQRTEVAVDKEVTACNGCDQRLVYRQDGWQWLREGHQP